MKIFELFESTPPLAAVVPGAKVGEIPAGGKPSGDNPTPVTQAGPTTTNTPATTQPTGFVPGQKVIPPPPGSSAVTAPAGQPSLGQTPATNPSTNGNGQNTMADMTSKIAALQATVNMMRGQLTPPPPPPN